MVDTLHIQAIHLIPASKIFPSGAITSHRALYDLRHIVLWWEWALAGPAAQYDASRIYGPRRREIKQHPPHTVFGRECSMPGRSSDPHVCSSASPSQCVTDAGGRSNSLLMQEYVRLRRPAYAAQLRALPCVISDATIRCIRSSLEAWRESTRACADVVNG